MTDFEEGQVSLFAQDTWCGRTSQGVFRATRAETSRRSSQRSSGSRSLTLPMCLCLRMESGPNQDGSTMNWVDGAWPGDSMTLSSTAYRSDANGFLWLRTLTDSQPQPYYLTLNIGEKPREPNQTKLSQVLERDADEKYHLSGTACQGILNRAERRGKELPPELKWALEEQVQSGSQIEDTKLEESQKRSEQNRTEHTQWSEPQSPSKNEQENQGGQRYPYPG